MYHFTKYCFVLLGTAWWSVIFDKQMLFTVTLDIVFQLMLQMKRVAMVSRSRLIDSLVFGSRNSPYIYDTEYKQLCWSLEQISIKTKPSY